MTKADETVERVISKVHPVIFPVEQQCVKQQAKNRQYTQRIVRAVLQALEEG